MFNITSVVANVWCPVLQHPDTSLMKEAVDEVIKRFRAQMDHVPVISLYDSDKRMGLRVPKEHFKRHITLFKQDM